MQSYTLLISLGPVYPVNCSCEQKIPWKNDVPSDTYKHRHRQTVMSKDGQFATWPLGQALKSYICCWHSAELAVMLILMYLPSKPGSSDPTQETCIYKDAAGRCVHACPHHLLAIPLLHPHLNTAFMMHCIHAVIKYFA